MVEKEEKPNNENVQMAIDILQGQPFPYILLSSEGYVDKDNLSIHIALEVHDGSHAGALLHALRHTADKLEEEFF